MLLCVVLLSVTDHCVLQSSVVSDADMWPAKIALPYREYLSRTLRRERF